MRRAERAMSPSRNTRCSRTASAVVTPSSQNVVCKSTGIVPFDDLGPTFDGVAIDQSHVMQVDDRSVELLKHVERRAMDGVVAQGHHDMVELARHGAASAIRSHGPAQCLPEPRPNSGPDRRSNEPEPIR